MKPAATCEDACRPPALGILCLSQVSDLEKLLRMTAEGEVLEPFNSCKNEFHEAWDEGRSCGAKAPWDSFSKSKQKPRPQSRHKMGELSTSIATTYLQVSLIRGTQDTQGGEANQA